MKKTIIAIAAVTLSTLLAGCIMGGLAYPEDDGRRYLEAHGYPSSFAEQVISGEKLDHTKVLELSKCKSTDVRFLVARNPNLTNEEIEIFIQDKNAFARSGTACNTSLSSNQIDILTEDPSHIVYGKLAVNSSLSEDALLRLHEKRNPGISSFAMNPNCPDSIRQEIKTSKDYLAKQWLEIIDGWKNDGVYQQRADGRWYKPRNQKK